MEEINLPVKEFFSWEEFSNFFDEWCEQTTSLFYKKKYILLNKARWGSIQVDPEVAHSLKYSTVRLACKNIKIKGILKCNTSSEETGSDALNPEKNQSCGAYIQLRLSNSQNSLVVTECQLIHNHEPCSIAFKHYFRKGHLISNSCLPVRTTNKISKQIVGAYDVKRLIACCKSPDYGLLDSLSALDYLFTTDPGAKIKLVFIEDSVIIKTVFMVTSFMASLCQRFPVILFFDKVMSLNEEFDLYCIFCVDANLKARDCAYVLTRKGTSNLLRFALASLVQIAAEIKYRVRCVILDLEIEEKKVVQDILPNAHPQMIRLQVLHKLCNKAVEMGAEEEKIKLILDMASCSSPEQYFQAVKTMALNFPSEFIKYFMEEWHDLREMWVDYWCYKTPHFNPAALLSRRKQAITAALSKSDTVAECILHLMVTETTKQSIQNEDDVAIGYHSVCSSENASLIEEELGFSRHDSYEVKDTPNGFLLSDGVSEFLMDRELLTCSCTIHSSSLLPCRHLFATRFRNGEALFDLKLLEKNKVASTKMS
ncbi:hypothetical protein GDO86_012603 [Hymenochirus boettgeri]|uniref:SWIM-type domain-containing protein n=1 Tax=Hymenochirus boettgeri TaxID=247094 RepID=A0A8T2IRS1_9PIPI|nr:hypothetical protein GDO86_012603 [Hymenochirus boettgeri]